MHRQTISLATLAILCVWLPSASRAVTQTETQQLAELTPAEAGALFGSAVAISPSGTTAAVAASGRNPAGAVDIYTFDGTNWVRVGTVIDPDGDSNDNFGASVAVSAFGDRIVVGAPGATINMVRTGAAYVFLDDPVDGWMNPEAKLVALNGAADDGFGTSVAISDLAAMVGADLADTPPTNPPLLTDSGAAYVYCRVGSSWTQEQKLEAPSGIAADSDLFGASVALSGSAALIGADGSNVAAGAAYVFRDGGGACDSNGAWTHEKTLMAPDPAAGDGFGFAVALSDNTALVGAEGRNNMGAAYVFRDPGLGWIQKAELLASNAAAFDRFGHSVGISPTSAVVGALGADNPATHNGKAYSFRLNGASWTEVSQLTASNGAVGDLFGNAVALSGTQILVGGVHHDGNSLTNSGAAYAFVPEPGAWALQAAALVSLACLGRAKRRQRV